MSMNAKSGTFWLGITLSLCGSLCSALGLACQRLSHKRNQELPVEQQVRSSKQWLNLLGVFLLFVESLFDLASFGFAPASILSCMGAMTLVFNMILAPAICGETVSKRDIGVNSIVFIGTIISVWFGPNETPDYDLPQLMGLFLDARFLVYAVALMAWIAGLLYVWHCLKDMDRPKGRFMKTDPLTRSRLLRFTYPALAGSIGGNTAVYAKASIELVKTTIKGDNQFRYAGTYFLIFLMIVCVVSQLKFLNGGLKRYESLFVVPVYQVFWITSGVLGALFYFDEVASMSSRDLGLFCLGAIISIFGILLHSTRTPQASSDISPEMLAELDCDGSSCATPVKTAFDVVEEYTTEYYSGRTPTSTRSLMNLPVSPANYDGLDLEDGARRDSEPILFIPKITREEEETPILMLPSANSQESLQDDEPADLESSSFNARRRRFMTY